MRTLALTGWSWLRTFSFLHPAGTICVLIASAPAIIACLIASFAWPLVHDAPTRYYVAWRVLSGAVPYRDIFIILMPGTVVLHMLVLKLFGPSNLGWRLFDLCWLLVTTGAIYWLCRPLTRWGGGLAGLFFFMIHLGGGAINMGQRDFLFCPLLLLGAHSLARSCEKNGNPTWALLAGLFLGAGVGIKPQCALYGLLMIAFLLVSVPRGWKKQVIPLVAGIAVVPLVLALWLMRVGALGPMLEITFKFVFPYFDRIGLVSRLNLPYYIFFWNANVLWVLVTLLAWRYSPKSARFWLIVLGAVFGCCNFVLQGKGYYYHLYPFSAFLFSWMGISLVWLFARRELILRALAFVCFSIFMYLFAMHCWTVSQTPMSAPAAAYKLATVNDLVSYLRPRIDPRRDTVQVVDNAEGGMHALFALRAVEPTRFMYDLQFHPDFKSPYARGLMAEFITGLRDKRPKYVVVFNYSWPGRTGPDRVKVEFPDLYRLLTQSYTREYSTGVYDVYGHRNDLETPGPLSGVP